MRLAPWARPRVWGIEVRTGAVARFVHRAGARGRAFSDLRRTAAPQRLADEGIGEHETCVGEIGEAQAHAQLRAILHVWQIEDERVILDAADHAPEPLAAVHGRRRLDLRLVARPA